MYLRAATSSLNALSLVMRLSIIFTATRSPGRVGLGVRGYAGRLSQCSTLTTVEVRPREWCSGGPLSIPTSGLQLILTCRIVLAKVDSPVATIS